MEEVKRTRYQAHLITRDGFKKTIEVPLPVEPVLYVPKMPPPPSVMDIVSPTDPVFDKYEFHIISDSSNSPYFAVYRER